MIREWANEFKEFILKGNAFDLAIGVIIGAAFSSIVTSMVDDIITPPIGFILGGIPIASTDQPLTNVLRLVLINLAAKRDRAKCE